MNSQVAEQLKELPPTPGVYRFFDAAGKLLYVGKAANLKRRVSSYFQKTHREPRLADLVRHIATIEFTATGSVIEALILEANEINAQQPPYNVRLKDNKTFAVIGVTDEDFPRVIVTRPTQKLKIPLKYQFGPYTSADQARTALQIIRKILPFRTTCQVPKLTLSTLHSKSVKGRSVNERVGRGCLDYQLGLCPGPCANAISKKDYAKLLRRVILFLQGKKQQVSRNLKRAMNQAAKGRDFERAAALRNQLFALDHIRDVALLRHEDLATPLRTGLGFPQRVEAYDISNISDRSAVGSMVVITDSKKDVSQYRKFQIKTVIGQNDVRMMEEVLTRRFRHLEWPLPDLVVVDGGEAHLRMAKRVLRKAQPTIPTVAVAKGPERKKLDLYFSHPALTAYGLRLTALIRLARDEAHRFAIRYHRTRRDKKFVEN